MTLVSLSGLQRLYLPLAFMLTGDWAACWDESVCVSKKPQGYLEVRSKARTALLGFLDQIDVPGELSSLVDKSKSACRVA
ncbi:hypothetical protein F5Y17DRAFT_439360 [Xylariaceae sp. FL0594]|nr:hypothetical protein F5Y17DRAFT_439360 [Xylariaceae sp. FL0594]